MSKISPVSIKYIIRAKLVAEGVVEKPDVIGAIFGQTEGLLGESLELRELQKEGKIGRIEVTLETEKGQTRGIIEIPTSLDKAETALIGAALETIERVGPSDATIRVETIEDVRASKREYVIERAKKLLKEFQEREMPETSELKATITETVRMMEITEYGRERLPAGPEIDEATDIVIVEGRADVLNLLRCGIRNVIALNGTSVPETIKKLCEEKIATLFVDGDRGGELIAKDVTSNCDISYIARAPDGKEVEELTKKEILKALRDKVEVEKFEVSKNGKFKIREVDKERYIDFSPYAYDFRQKRTRKKYRQDTEKKKKYKRYKNKESEKIFEEISKEDQEKLAQLQEEIIGTRGAYLLDSNLEILGKVPVSELPIALKGVKAYAIVADGLINQQIANTADQTGVKIIVAKDFSRRGNFNALTFKEVARRQ